MRDYLYHVSRVSFYHNSASFITYYQLLDVHYILYIIFFVSDQA